MFQDGFPIYLRDDVTTAVGMIPQKTYNNVTIDVSEDTIQYFQDNAVIRFPYRIYYIDSSDEVIDNLSPRQKMILHCIYSRSCDGFVRQMHIYSLLQMDYEDWAIPYIVKICDEYVVEILEMTYDILKEQDTVRIKRFCLENIVPFCKSYNRMISYWNEYYRYRYNNFHKYIGRKLFRDCFGYSKSMERRE
ncbi:hypothetical protein [Psychrobacillus sp. OK032]|uniref:hypothetical protein n=1 Tax=Psychrobacillus sp. OK032 TaxID=1884358 RepID=UPI0008C9FEC3|nr:hypothetical protein [Psychrobacillus sp. OK032]SES44591.1 hypothetical protein SAMN05518872_1151 [Psychrobacillus sp. OK032]